MNRAHLLLAASAVTVLIPLADASLKGCLLLALAASAAWLLRQRSAAERHLAWVSAMSLLLVLPLLSALLPGWNVLPESWRIAWEPEPPIIDAPQAVGEVPITHNTPAVETPLIAINETTQRLPAFDVTESLDATPSFASREHVDVAPDLAVAPVSTEAAKQSGTSIARPLPVLQLSLLGIWLCGTLWFSARLLRSWLQLRRLSRRGSVVTHGPLFDHFQGCCDELKVGRRVRLLQGDANAMPMAWGLMRPCILVPADCEVWPTSQQRAVLLHELGHVIRRDPLWHAIVQVATAVYWFHPLVWLAAWRIHVERERACDDLVLNRGVAAGDYARHLLDVVSNGRLRRIGASVGVAMASNNKLEGRVRSILDNRQDRRPLTRLLLTAGVLIALAVGTPLAMMRAEGDTSVAKSDDIEQPDENTSEDDNSEASTTEADQEDEVSDAIDALNEQPAHIESLRINYDESMLVVWNEAGAVGVIFDSPELDTLDSRSPHVICRYRFNDGSDTEVTGEQFNWITGEPRDLDLPIGDLRLTNLTTTSATVEFDPAVVSVHPLDRTFFADYDRQIPSQPELRPAVDLAEFILPDEGIQQQMRDREYNGQATIPGYPRAPLPCKVRYADNGLIVATPDGVAVFDFLDPVDRREGNEHRRGIAYNWRFVSADGTIDDNGTGEVWELSRDDANIYAESLHYIEAGPLHLSWSINTDDAGWLYYDPAWHGVWLIAPEVAVELADAQTDAAKLQLFAFGPRSVAAGTRYINAVEDHFENLQTEETSAQSSDSGEHSLRGFNLAPHFFTGDWPSLYEPGQPLDRDQAIALGGVWRCVVNPGNWRVHYSPLRGDFYVHHTVNVSNGEGESVYYGPIEGNPIELLRLDNYIVESINRHREVDAPGTPDGLSELQSLIDSNEPTLVAAGFRILTGVEEFEVYEEHYLRQSVDAAAEWMSTMRDYEPLISETLAAMDRHRARIEELQVEVPASEYGNHGTEPTDEELALNWGEDVDGLRLAVLPWEEGEPSIRLAERVEAWLLIQNVSDEPIRFSTFGAMDNVRGVLVDEETGDEQQIVFAFRGGYPVALRCQLDPGEVMRIKQAALWSGVETLQDGSTLINVQPGHTYRLTMSLQLPELFREDGEGRILNPGRGEYFNRLEAGDVRIRVAEIDGAVPPESEEVDMNDDQSNAQSANDNGSGFRHSLHGFDLTPYRFTGDWDALFEIDAPLNRELPIALGGVWECRVNTHAWRMYYSPLKQFFYVHLRDGDRSDYFGPIEGNGIELLRIEEHLVNSFNRAIGTDLVETSFNLRYIESLIESQEPTLIAIGFRALIQLDELAIYEEYRLSPVVDRVAEEVSEVPELSDLAEAAVAYMNEQHDRIEALKVTIDDSEYTPGRAPTDEELAAQWGPEVDGLSLAVVSWYMHPFDSPANLFPPGERLGMTNWAAGEVPALAAGDIIGSMLIVRNVSGEPLRIATLNTMDGVGAIMTDEETGHSAMLNYVHVTGRATTERYLLQPGEVITFKQSQISVVEGDLHPLDRPFDPDSREFLYGEIRVREGRSYTIDYSVDAPSAFSYVEEGRIALPAKGEFYNKMTAPTMRFEVTATTTAAVDDDQPAELSVLHEDADGTMRLTPTNEEERELVNQILVWGSNDYDGWRVGALLVNALDSDEPLTAGETAGVRYFLQNVTDQPKSILVAPMSEAYPVMGAGGQINLNTHAGSGTIEITAQPGEAISPDGHYVLVDTTGLPDGEYELYTTAAFWMQNDNGGASSPWRVGGVLMTIGAGGTFDGEPMTDDEGIVWGGTVAGLRVGMRFPEGKTQFANGSLLQGDLFVKNTTSQPITFEWDKPAPLDQNQVVYTAEGEYVRLNSVFYTGARAQNPQTFTLGPGEKILLGDAKLQSVVEASEPGPEDPAQLVAATGSFTWQVHVQLNVPAIPQFTFVVGSGPVPFEIVWSTDDEWPNGVEEESEDDATNDGDAASDDNTDDLSILHESEDGTLRFTPTSEEDRALVDQILTWTDAVDGWRVGSLLMNDLESDEPLTQGDTATVRYFMQNVGDQTQTITVAPINGWSRDLRAGGWMVIETLPGSGPVKFTAQPGEAVSPSGFSVDVDTTGLADGQYELDATTVFWRQDANGQGASSPWRVAGVPMTIGTGESLASETMTDEDGIHWGEVVSGLRFGIQAVEGREQWTVGSLIEADLYVKNTSDEPITFTWDAPPPGEQGQTIYNSTWEHVQLNAAFYTGLRPSNPQSFTVAPGEHVAIGKALLQSVSEASTPGPSDPMQLVATEGHFYWVMNIFVQLESVPQLGIVLGSGTQEIEIVPAEDAQ